jgi:hypothetical protein
MCTMRSLNNALRHAARHALTLSPTPSRRSAALLWAAGLFLLLAGCPVSKFSKKNARPWEPKLGNLFDDATDVCAPWASSNEPWARREHELSARRALESDLVAQGQIEEVVDTLSGAAVKQVVLQFQVGKMLRGNEDDLPDGKRRITLIVSGAEDAQVSKKMIRRDAILWIRWLKGDDPPFHWHVTCATGGVTTLVKRHLQGRARKEAGQTPQD